MLTFTEVNNNRSENFTKLKNYNVAVLGDCSTQHFSKALKGCGYKEGFDFEIYDAEYNQILAQIMDKNSNLYCFNPDVIIIYMCCEKLYESFCNTPFNIRNNFAADVYAEIQNIWVTINTHINTNIIHFNFAENDDRVFGCYANHLEFSYIYQLRKLNLMLSDGIRNFKNVFTFDISAIQNRYGRGNTYDEKMYYIAKMPLSLHILPEVAMNVVTLIKAFSGCIKKCIVLDLDNTLWGGVIGDDGIEGIQIGDLGIGRVFTDIQMWLKELKKRGIILAVCSKNDEDNAKEPFINHPDMVLRLNDISIFIANWDSKVTNIKIIQESLNIAMDSIVFIDDNPFERNLVRLSIEDITVPDLPDDPALYLTTLKNLNLFETVTYSDADNVRTRQYQEEIKRVDFQKQFTSYNDYLIQLKMSAKVKPFDEFNYPRIAQLTQRSNQFNLRTVRYTEANIKEVACSDSYITRYFTLKDNFGNHGVVSIVILNKQGNTLFIEEWVMSCRVLKRSMEEFIVNKIIEIARNCGYKKVRGEYIKTQKNKLVGTIYEQLGFSSTGNDNYEVIVNEFKNITCFVEEEN